jgi:glycosyltransferase involved in cell wall biosynthesis
VKVLTYTSLFPNAAQPELGVFIYQRMAHFAAREKNEVLVVAPIPYAPSWLPGARWKKWTGIPSVEQRGNLTIYHPAYPLLPKVSFPIQAMLMFLSSFRLVRKLHREHKFDVIDAHYVYPDGLAGVMLGRLLDVPVVVSARGTDINSFPAFQLIRPQIRYALRQAAGAIAVCKALQEVMISLSGPGHPVQVIGNGVDAARFFPVIQEEARRELNLALDGPVVLAVGSLIPRKGYHFLIPAFAEVRKQFSGAHLYILGEGESRGELQRLIERLSLGDYVHLQGNCPNERLRYWYSGADISCLVSSREGWPNVLLESLACGTPVVATGLWGTPEVITSPDLGIMVEQTVPSITSGLKSALNRKWDREQIARHARERDWNVVALELEEYLAGVLYHR